MDKTHEALSLALNALEQHYLEDAHSLQGKAITAIREALAQPEQEPVAWIVHAQCPYVTMDAPSSDEEGLPRTPLYTAPPQEQRCYCGNIYRLGVVHREDSFCDEHPRKPLTNEDISMINWESLKTKKDCVRAIEAAHGIKE